MHTRTRYNPTTGRVELGPAPPVSSHVQDWEHDGAVPVIVGDYGTIDNVDASNRKLWRVVSVQQTIPRPITLRVKLSGKNLPSPSDNFSLRIYGSYAPGGGTTDVLSRIQFPAGTYRETQFSVTINPISPVSYIYCDLFATAKGSITVRDLEISQDGGALAQFGEWLSDPIDLAEQMQPSAPAGSAGLKPLHLGFYYGDIANVDNMESVTHAKEALSSFDMLVFDEPGELTARQAEIVQHLISRGVLVYGYTHLSGGASPALSDAQIQAVADRCAANGYTGVFLDEAGYGVGTPYVTRTRFNTAVNYTHSKGLKVMANSWFPQEILNSDVDPEFNPTGTPTALTTGDWVLHESFYTRSDDKYAGDPEGGFMYSMTKYIKTRDLAKPLGIKVAALAYHMVQVPITDNSDRDKSYILALMLDVAAWAYGNTTANNLLKWRTKPNTFVGTAWQTPLTQVSPTRWERQSDVAIVWFEAHDSPLQRTAVAVPRITSVWAASLHRSLTPGQFTAARVALIWQTSNDREAWSELNDTAERFVRVAATLQS